MGYFQEAYEYKKLNKDLNSTYLETLFQLVDLIMKLVGPSLMYKLTGGSGDIEDIEVWEADYSDDDNDIYFKEKEFLEYLQQIEEDSLFKVGLIQTEDETLEIAIKESQTRLEEQQHKIDLQNSTIVEQRRKLNDFKKKISTRTL